MVSTTTTHERTTTPIAMIAISVITTPAKVTTRAVALELIARLGTATTATVHTATATASASTPSAAVYHAPTATTVSTPIAWSPATTHRATGWGAPTARSKASSSHGLLVVVRHRA